MLYLAHNTLLKSFRSNRDRDGPNPELLLLPTMHFHEEADKNAREYKYIFPSCLVVIRYPLFVIRPRLQTPLLGKFAVIINYPTENG